MKKMIYILFCLVISYTFIACSDDDDEREYKSYDYHYEDVADSLKSMIQGVWHQVNQVDSTVLVVDKYVIKKYIYQRGTNHIIEMTDLGSYTLRKIVYDDPKLSDREVITFWNYKALVYGEYTSQFGFSLSKKSFSIWNLKLECIRVE